MNSALDGYERFDEVGSMVGQWSSQRRWPFVLLAIVAAAGVYFSYAGMAMAGMFTVSNPDHREHWRHVAYIYLALLGLALLGLLFASVALWRRRGTRGPDQSAAI